MSQPAEPNQPHRPYPRVVAYPPKPQRHRPVNAHGATNSLVMEHHDIADKIARNMSRRTGHPVEDLRQIALIGIIQASRRFKPERGSFRAFARNYANGEVFHFLRDKGFPLKVSPRWRELHARGQKLIRLGTTTPQNIPAALGISKEQWEEIVLACSQRVVALDVLLAQEESDHEERQ